MYRQHILNTIKIQLRALNRIRTHTLDTIHLHIPSPWVCTSQMHIFRRQLREKQRLYGRIRPQNLLLPSKVEQFDQRHGYRVDREKGGVQHNRRQLTKGAPRLLGAGSPTTATLDKLRGRVVVFKEAAHLRPRTVNLKSRLRTPRMNVKRGNTACKQLSAPSPVATTTISTRSVKISLLKRSRHWIGCNDLRFDFHITILRLRITHIGLSQILVNGAFPRSFKFGSKSACHP